MHHRELLPNAVAVILPDDAGMLGAVLDTLGAAPAAQDAELLKVVGIDLEEVRSAVRQTFGADALDRLGRRACTSRGSRGVVPLADARHCWPAP